MHTCTNVYLYKCILVQMYTCTNAYLYKYILVQIYTCTNVSLNIYILAQIHPFTKVRFRNVKIHKCINVHECMTTLDKCTNG